MWKSTRNNKQRKRTFFGWLDFHSFPSISLIFFIFHQFLASFLFTFIFFSLNVPFPSLLALHFPLFPPFSPSFSFIFLSLLILGRHGLFYIVCQATMYCICFKHRQLFEMPDWKTWFNSLKLDEIISSSLNPLIIVQEQVGREFTKISCTFLFYFIV